MTTTQNTWFTWRTALRLLFMLLMFIGVYDGIRYKNVYDTILYSIVFIGEAFLLFKEYNKHSKQ